MQQRITCLYTYNEVIFLIKAKNETLFLSKLFRGGLNTCNYDFSCRDVR